MSSPAPQIRYPRRRSFAGPIVLITIGVVFLLGNFHILTWARLGHLFARYWPVLIILWGVIKLIEHWQDNRAGVPSRGIGVGGAFLLCFLIIFGIAATTGERVNWGAIQSEMDMDEDFAGIFGNSYTFTNTAEQAIPAAATFKIVSDRGDVVINSWDDAKVKVIAHKKLSAGNEADSRKYDEQTQPTITVSGDQVTISANTGGAGARPVVSDLEIYMPRKGALDISTKRGDIRLSHRDGEVRTSSSRGDVTVADLAGPLNVSLRRGSVHGADIKGDVAVDGRVDDTTLSNVSGTVRLTGEFFGQMNLSKIAKGVIFHSSRTDMELGRLEGDLTMESGDLRVNAALGPMHVITRSKDIHLENISGDVKVDNSNGVVEYHAGRQPGAVEINNTRGNVQVTMPPQASFTVEAQASRGEISTDFPNIRVESERHYQRATGSVGNGGPQVKLNNSGGDVEIRRAGVAPPPLPPAPAEPTEPGMRGTPPSAPGAPAAPRAPRPRVSKLTWCPRTVVGTI